LPSTEQFPFFPESEPHSEESKQTEVPMGRRFAEIAFTPAVKEQQTLHGSRSQYRRVETSGNPGALLGPAEQDFIRRRDGFYMASTSETGWPYIQYRGGPKGFLHVIDDHTLAFADLRGNMQYISTGNLLHDDRVALFLMDYAYQTRLKILGHAEILEDTPVAPNPAAPNPAVQAWLDRLRDPKEKTPAERAILIHVEAWDWNCPQHITPRFTEEELAEALEPMRRRIADLEQENASLRQTNA
jgi:predicted pyridoxine 5'-phosphate oxidase superfamily flavin-nucleotide-binding protein